MKPLQFMSTKQYNSNEHNQSKRIFTTHHASKPGPYILFSVTQAFNR